MPHRTFRFALQIFKSVRGGSATRMCCTISTDYITSWVPDILSISLSSWLTTCAHMIHVFIYLSVCLLISLKLNLCFFLYISVLPYTWLFILCLRHIVLSMHPCVSWELPGCSCCMLAPLTRPPGKTLATKLHNDKIYHNRGREPLPLSIATPL